jgi:SAM-dependent methyltransferase
MTTAIDHTQRFSTRVDAYVAARPPYPAAMVAHLQQACGLSGASSVADIGSGTGISSRPFLDAGLNVIAVEPNGPMLQAARDAFAGNARFVAMQAPTEATGIAAASIDLAFAGQAFHWFDAAAFRTELQRILRPGAQLALAWNVRAKTGPLMAGYHAVLQRFSAEYRSQHSDEDRGISIEEKHREKMTTVFGHAQWQTERFDHAQRLDREGLVARADSASYAPPRGHADHAPMVQALYALFDAQQQGGTVQLPMTTWLFHAALR